MLDSIKNEKFFKEWLQGEMVEAGELDAEDVEHIDTDFITYEMHYTLKNPVGYCDFMVLEIDLDDAMQLYPDEWSNIQIDAFNKGIDVEFPMYCGGFDDFMQAAAQKEIIEGKYHWYVMKDSQYNVAKQKLEETFGFLEEKERYFARELLLLEMKEPTYDYIKSRERVLKTFATIWSRVNGMFNEEYAKFASIVNDIYRENQTEFTYNVVTREYYEKEENEESPCFNKGRRR